MPFRPFKMVRGETMKNTFYYGYLTGMLLVLWLQLIEPFSLYSVLTLQTFALMCCLVCLLAEEKQ